MIKKTLAFLSPKCTRRNTMHDTSPATIPIGCPAVVISQFPPNFSKDDLEKLLKDFQIAEPVALPTTTRFAYPLRTTVKLKDQAEALRVMHNLDGSVVGTRQLSVRMANEIDAEEKTATLIEDIANELKTSIISTLMAFYLHERTLLTKHCLDTARVYYPELADKILEVRELTKPTGDHFAFLQARDPVTIFSDLDEQTLSSQNVVKWRFIMGMGVEDNGIVEETSPRLNALKVLQKELERQGVLAKIWGNWEGSSKLEMNRTV
jgi:hypothetical protein